MERKSSEKGKEILKENERDKTTISDLPDDVTLTILQRLPLKSAVMACTVSKRWAKMIGIREALPRILFTSVTSERTEDSSGEETVAYPRWFHYVFQEKQPELLGQTQVSFPRFVWDFYGYVDVTQTLLGLVFCQNYKGNSVICNLVGRKFIDLPKVDISEAERVDLFLGYNKKQFKVLCVISSPTRMESQVLTLLDENSSWRKLDCNIPPHRPRYGKLCSDGKVYYGAVSCTDVKCFFIMCFDLETEEFSKIDAPKDARFDTLLKINNKLAIVRNYPPSSPNPNQPHPHIWIYEAETWSKLTCEIPSSSEVTTEEYDCIGTIGNDQFIFTPQCYLGDEMHVIYYHALQKCLEKIIIPGKFPDDFFFFEAFLDYIGDPEFCSIEATKDKIFSKGHPCILRTEAEDDVVGKK